MGADLNNSDNEKNNNIIEYLNNWHNTFYRSDTVAQINSNIAKYSAIENYSQFNAIFKTIFYFGFVCHSVL